jgi:hypothetical protein
MYDAEFQGIPTYLSNRLNTMGLIRIDDYKTKYNQIRVYVRFGAFYVGDLLPYGIMYGLRFPNLFRHANFKIPYYKLDSIRIPGFINYLLIPYQRFVYRQVYKHTIKKFPKYRENLLSGADYPELLKNL